LDKVNYLFAKQCLPSVGGLGAKPSNESIKGAAPAFKVALEESESDARSSNGETGAFLLGLGDNMSISDEFLCAGNSVGAEGDPIHKRSKRTSGPFFEA